MTTNVKLCQYGRHHGQYATVPQQRHINDNATPILGYAKQRLEIM